MFQKLLAYPAVNGYLEGEGGEEEEWQPHLSYNTIAG